MGFFDNVSGSDIASILQSASLGLGGTGNAPAYLDPRSISAMGLSGPQGQLMAAQANANRQAAYTQAAQPVVGRWGGGGTLPTGDAANAAGAKAYYDTLMASPSALQAQTGGAIDLATKGLGLQWQTALQNEKMNQLLSPASNMQRYMDLAFGRSASNDPDENYSAAQALTLTFPDQAKVLKDKADKLKEAQLKIGQGLNTGDGPTAAAASLRGANGLMTAPARGEAADADTSGVDIPAQPNGSPPSANGQLAYRNNNPGNLKFAGQAGAQPGEGGYAKFETPEAGLSALTNQIKNSAMRGQTFGQYVKTYAPEDPVYGSKVLSVLAASGVNANTPLKSIDPQALTAAQARVESQTKVSPIGTGTLPADTTTPPPPPQNDFVAAAEGRKTIASKRAERANTIVDVPVRVMGSNGETVDSLQKMRGDQADDLVGAAAAGKLPPNGPPGTIVGLTPQPTEENKAIIADQRKTMVAPAQTRLAEAPALLGRLDAIKLLQQGQHTGELYPIITDLNSKLAAIGLPQVDPKHFNTDNAAALTKSLAEFVVDRIQEQSSGSSNKATRLLNEYIKESKPQLITNFGAFPGIVENMRDVINSQYDHDASMVKEFNKSTRSNAQPLPDDWEDRYNKNKEMSSPFWKEKQAIDFYSKINPGKPIEVGGPDDTMFKALPKGAKFMWNGRAATKD